MADKYDKAYERGYLDGLSRMPVAPPADDSEINYRDGYKDGQFKRDQMPSDDEIIRDLRVGRRFA
jgi:hypothetical protein